jgi:hypothetical protein
MDGVFGTHNACIRVGALLIVKVDWVVSIHQLTAAQQLHLDHQPNLATAPHKVLQALKLERVNPPEKAPNYIDASIPSQALINPKIDNP